MKHLTLKSFVVAAVAAVTVACTMNGQDAPPLTGPSEFGQSVSVAVNPDSIPQDGASQSLVTVTVLDPDSKPMRNVTLRVETRVNGLAVDFGSLSARSIVTSADGRATFVYTAPPSTPGPSVDNFTVVDIGATPIGTDFNNAVLRTAAIRLTPPSTIIPPGDLVAAFTASTNSPTDNQTVLFDASSSRGTIAEYQWDFGDGGRGSGRTVSHAYTAPGTYVVRLTIVDPFGRSTSSAQTVTVTLSTAPTASFFVTPNPVRVGVPMTFNGTGSRPAPGAAIVSYSWDFGDGTSSTTSGPTTGKTYAVAGTYTARLFVTDSAGRVSPPATTSVTINP